MPRILAACTLVLIAFLPAAGQSLADLGVHEIAVAPSPFAKAGEPAWTSHTFSQDATGLVVSGTSSDRALRALGRFGTDPWQELAVVFSATGETFYAGTHGEVVHSGGRFEVRFETEASIHIDAAGVFDNREDADRLVAREGEEVEDEGPRTGAIFAPRMYDRTEWNAEPFRGNPVPLARPDYLYMAFHHAAGFGAHTHQEGLEQVKAIQRLHQNVRGWSDIGYHFVMDRAGRLYQGRPFLGGDVPLAAAPELALGAHVGGMNTGNIGVCVLGCYHPPAGASCEDVMAEAAIDSLAVMYAFLSDHYGVPPDDIRGHRQFETARTACPGDNNMAIIEALRDRVRTYLATGNDPVGAVQIAAVTDESGVVHLSWEFIDGQEITSYRIERVQGTTSVTVFEGKGSEPNTVSDDGAVMPGLVTYHLYATSVSGREQLLAVIQADVQNPQQHILTENFPNPFSRSTTIRYYLPQDGIVHLAVYDMLGRELEKLDVGPRDGGQWYHVEFDAADIPAGIYIYRLQVEGFSGTVFNEARSLIRVR